MGAGRGDVVFSHTNARFEASISTGRVTIENKVDNANIAMPSNNNPGKTLTSAIPANSTHDTHLLVMLTAGTSLERNVSHL